MNFIIMPILPFDMCFYISGIKYNKVTVGLCNEETEEEEELQNKLVATKGMKKQRRGRKTGESIGKFVDLIQ